jgi:hypothetical protein
MTDANRNTPRQQTATRLDRLAVFMAQAEQLQAAGLMPGNLGWQIENAIIDSTEPNAAQQAAWDELIRKSS